MRLEIVNDTRWRNEEITADQDALQNLPRRAFQFDKGVHRATRTRVRACENTGRIRRVVDLGDKLIRADLVIEILRCQRFLVCRYDTDFGSDAEMFGETANQRGFDRLNIGSVTTEQLF